MQGVCGIASINLYAEEKEHFLFAYDAPMTFQIHFCLTINQSVTIIFLSCLKYQWPTNHSPIFSVSFGKMEVNANNPHRFIRPLIKSFKLFSSFPVPPSFVCRHPGRLFLEGVQATSREKGRQDTQQYPKSVQTDLGLMPDCVLSPNHLLPGTFRLFILSLLLQLYRTTVPHSPIAPSFLVAP